MTVEVVDNDADIRDFLDGGTKRFAEEADDKTGVDDASEE